MVNRILANMLHSLASDIPKQCNSALPQAEFSYNCMTNRLTGLCPFDFVYTKILNLITYLLVVLERLANQRMNWQHKLLQSITR